MKRNFSILIVFISSIFSSAIFAAQTELIIKPYTITVDGKTAQIYRIEQPDGTWGYRGQQGDMFNVLVKNETAVPTVIHWHGLIVPNKEDGVPGVTQAAILPGQSYAYNFKLVQAGTYWMHSHYQLQLQQMLSAPLIIDDKNSLHKPEALMFLTDFSFKQPQTILNQLQGKDESGKVSAQTSMASMSAGHDMAHMDHSGGMDLADVKYDALLTNLRTLTNPDVFSYQPGTQVRLRIIDASAATNFWVNLGALQGTLIAVDGEPIVPITGSKFSLVVGQRMDILVTLPKNKADAYPIIAQGEGTQLQTGIILATPHVRLPQLKETTSTMAPAITMQQEEHLRAIKPLTKKTITKILTVDLTGNMQTYQWAINGKRWPDYSPLTVKKGDRVEIIFRNEDSMAHPMHLHGHVFEVTEINGKAIQGALRDTVLIPAKGEVKIQFDADNPGNWLIHCHILYHGATGMMTLLHYSGVVLPAVKNLKKA